MTINPPDTSSAADALAAEPPPTADQAPAGDVPGDQGPDRPVTGTAAEPPAARVGARTMSVGAPALLSDEGVPFDYLGDAPEHIVNLSDDPIEGRRRELHVGGKTYSHVGEYLGKSWLYRHDA